MTATRLAAAARSGRPLVRHRCMAILPRPVGTCACARASGSADCLLWLGMQARTGSAPEVKDWLRCLRFGHSLCALMQARTGTGPEV